MEESYMAIKKIGHIVNTYGLKGMVKISLSTTEPENRYETGKKVLIDNQMNEQQEYEITDVIFKNSRIVYVGFKGYTDINDIEWMIGRDVFSNVRATKGTFFYDDLVGMKVFSDTGEELGSVTTVNKMPQGPYLLIDKAVMVPFNIPLFVESCDKKAKEIKLTALGSEAFRSSK